MRAKNFLVRNNLWYDVGGAGRGDGTLFFVVNGVQNLIIEHNTALQTGKIIFSDSSSEAMPGFVFRNNIAPHNAYGIFAGGVGSQALNKFFPEAVFEKNVITGPWPTPGGATPSDYSAHPRNYFPPSIDQVGFVDWRRRNFRLLTNGPYKRVGTDGKDVGADMDAIEAATAGVMAKFNVEKALRTGTGAPRGERE